MADDIETIQADIDQRIADLREELNYNPWFFLKWRTEHVQKQVQFTQAQGAKITAWVDAQAQLTLLKERFDHNIQLEKKTFEANIEAAIAQVEAQKLNQKLLALASEMGVDLINLGLVRKEQLMNDILVERQVRESAIKVEEHRQLKEIDFQYLTEETQLKLKAALAYQQISLEQVRYFLDKILALVEERYQMQFSGKPITLIQDKVKYYNMVISGWEAKLGRLIQGDNGQNIRGSDQATERRGLPEPDVAEGQE